MSKKTECVVLCIQETRRSEDVNSPKIKEMKLVALRPHRQYGSGIFLRNSEFIRNKFS